jgi:hypothetical protein
MIYSRHPAVRKIENGLVVVTLPGKERQPAVVQKGKMHALVAAKDPISKVVSCR